MNKKYLMGLIALGALTVTSCSNDEVMDAALQQEAKAIQFSTYLGRDVETKGAELTTNRGTNTLQDTGFGVFAYYTGKDAWSAIGASTAPNFMYNQQVTWSDPNWVYSPVKFWPTMENDKISFFAYAPYSVGDNHFTGVFANTSTGAPIIVIDQGTDVTTMIDFVAAPVIDQEKTTTVSFTLKHEMSRLNLQANVDKSVTVSAGSEAKTFVNIKNITLNGKGGNFYTSGAYTFANTSNAAGTWAGSTNDAPLDLANIMDKGDVTASTATNDTDYNTGVQGVRLDNATAVPLFKSNQYLFLIPATNATGTGLASNAATATIEYDIVTEDNALKGGYSCTPAKKTVYLPAEILKQGLAYTVTFTIKLEEIVVSATVNDWAGGTNPSPTDVPYTPDNATPVEP